MRSVSFIKPPAFSTVRQARRLRPDPRGADRRPVPPHPDEGALGLAIGIGNVGHGDDLIDDPRQLQAGLAAIDLRLEDLANEPGAAGGRGAGVDAKITLC
jgi:hypothetical protein